MNISHAAKAAHLSAKMVRYYESIGLITPPTRTESGYRVYTMSDIHTLRFIKRARNLGFSIEKVSNLLALWRDKERSSSDVRKLAEAHIDTLKKKIEEMQSVVRTLAHLVESCHGDDRPACPLLDDLADRQEPPETVGLLKKPEPRHAAKLRE